MKIIKVDEETHKRLKLQAVSAEMTLKEYLKGIAKEKYIVPNTVLLDGLKYDVLLTDTIRITEVTKITDFNFEMTIVAPFDLKFKALEIVVVVDEKSYMLKDDNVYCDSFNGSSGTVSFYVAIPDYMSKITKV